MEGCDGADLLYLACSHCAQCVRRAGCERGDDLGRRGRMTCSGGGTAARNEPRSSEKAEKSAAVPCTYRLAWTFQLWSR
jgi:hypothetical protein